jgi:hypothetical protein
LQGNAENRHRQRVDEQKRCRDRLQQIGGDNRGKFRHPEQDQRQVDHRDQDAQRP